MKIIVAVIFTLIAAPFIFLFGIGSASGAATTGDHTGLLITAAAVALIGVVWWIALRESRPGSTMTTRRVSPVLSGLIFLLVFGCLAYFWHSMGPAA